MQCAITKWTFPLVLVNNIRILYSILVHNTCDELFVNAMNNITRNMSNYTLIMNFWMHLLCNCSQRMCIHLHLALFSWFWGLFFIMHFHFYHNCYSDPCSFVLIRSLWWCCTFWTKEEGKTHQAIGKTKHWSLFVTF